MYSVQRLATGWRVRGSNPIGSRDILHQSRPALEFTQPATKQVRYSGRCVEQTTHLHPSSRLKKEQSYTSTSPLCLHSLLQGEVGFFLYIPRRPFCCGGRDSSVGIATGYGLDGPGIESRWGRDFPHPTRTALRPRDPTPPPVQWVPCLYRG